MGDVGVDQAVRIEALFSGDVTADMELPYAITFKSMNAPTVTAVAA